MKISDIKKRLREAPLSVAHAVANRGAPALTSRAQAAFASGQDVYGGSRHTGKDGRALTLVKTGAVKSRLGFLGVGTQIRCDLGTRYARYLIGKYGVLPNSKAAIPAAWASDLLRIVREVRV